MSVSPDAMDGVPEEPGYYYGKIDSGEWQLYQVKENDFESDMDYLFAKAIGAQHGFDRCDFYMLKAWSEKIEPPEAE